jgi:hypothetical protein
MKRKISKINFLSFFWGGFLASYWYLITTKVSYTFPILIAISITYLIVFVHDNIDMFTNCLTFDNEQINKLFEENLKLKERVQKLEEILTAKEIV